MTLRHFDEKHPDLRAFDQCWLLVRRSNIDQILERASTLATPRGGVPMRNPYTATATVMSVVVTVAHRGVITLAKMFEHLWFMTPDQLALVGMAEHITAQSRHDLDAYYEKYIAEYNLFRHRFDQLVDTFDSSPHPRQVREKNAVRWQRAKSLSAEQRVALAAKEEVFITIIDCLTRASLIDADLSTWRGDVGLDETLLPGFASRKGCGPGMNSMGVADPDAAWYPVKGVERPWLDVFHMFVVTVPAVSPYARETDNLALGIRVKMPHGESNTQAAINSIKASWRARGKVLEAKDHMRVIADRGYTNEDRFAYEMHRLGYSTIANARQEIPKYEHSRTTRLAAGYDIKHGRLICPAGRHISRKPLGWPPDVRQHEPSAIDERQRVIDEIALYAAPTNSRPKLVRVFNPDACTWDQKIAIRVICPAAAGLVQCAIFDKLVDYTSRIPIATNPPTGALPPSCKSPNVTVHLEPKMLKHLDDFVRGSFEHNDWFNYNRSNNEKHFAQAKGVANGALDGKRIELMGRARVGFIVTIALALENMRRIENRERWYATNTRQDAAKATSSAGKRPPKYRYTPREADRKMREKILKEAWRRRGRK